MPQSLPHRLIIMREQNMRRQKASRVLLRQQGEGGLRGRGSPIFLLGDMCFLVILRITSLDNQIIAYMVFIS